MKKPSAILAALLLLLPGPAFAHRLDEYLEATILSVDSERVEGTMRLIPGIAVSSEVIASIDTNGDGLENKAETEEGSSVSGGQGSPSSAPELSSRSRSRSPAPSRSNQTRSQVA